MSEPQNQVASKQSQAFFANSAIVFVLAIVLSFVATYFIPLATGTEQFALLHHFHGVVFAAWVALYVVQTQLARHGRMQLHRELGIVGVALAGAIVPLGMWMAVFSIEKRLGNGTKLPFENGIYNLVDTFFFAAAFGWAVFEARRRVEWHRRLVFVAILGLLGPAISRWVLKLPMSYPYLDMAPNLLADSALLALALHDRRMLGRIHPVTRWALIIFVPVHVVQPLIVHSKAWNDIAPVIFGFR